MNRKTFMRQMFFVILCTFLLLLYSCGNIINEESNEGTTESFLQKEDIYTLQYYLKSNGTYIVTDCVGTCRDIVIPLKYDNKTVTEISSYAFHNQSSIESISIPQSILSIGENAFSGCTNLKRVIYDGDFNTWCGISFEGSYSNPFELETVYFYNKDETNYLPVNCIKENQFENWQGTEMILPQGIERIGKNAFLNCEKLESITISQNVKYIDERAFCNCSNLTSVIFKGKSELESIAEYAFNKCRSLTSIAIGGNMTSIGERAFSDCSSLTSIILKNGVTSIGKAAFLFCYELTSITIADGVTYIGDSAFACCESLTSITIPNSVTYIGDGAFGSCESLTSITIPNSVTIISNNAFSSCYKLTTITMGDSVRNIGDCAFRFCSALTSITIPESVTSIGENAFRFCKELTSITFLGTKAQWNAIYKDYSWNYATGNYTIHCMDGDINK